VIDSGWIAAIDAACRTNWTQHDVDEGMVKVCPAGCIPGMTTPGICPFLCDENGLIEDYREAVPRG
jgi:hypothetical protein